MKKQEQKIEMEEFTYFVNLWVGRYPRRYYREFSEREKMVLSDLKLRISAYLERQLRISIRDNHTPRQFEVIVCTDMRYLFHYPMWKSWGAYDWSAFGFSNWKTIVEEYVFDR